MPSWRIKGFRKSLRRRRRTKSQSDKSGGKPQSDKSEKLQSENSVPKQTDDEDEETHAQPDKNELQNTLRTLTAKLEDLQTCNDLIIKHGAALQRSLSELEQIDTSQSDTAAKVKSVNERATLFRITSNAMINACADYLQLAQTQGRRWQKMLQYEHEQRLRLEEMVEQLAKQHSSFEKQARKAVSTAKLDNAQNNTAESEEDEDDFYDAVDDHTQEFKVCLPPDKGHKRTGSGVSIDSLGHNAGLHVDNYDSSDTDSERGPEAKVISAKRRPGDKKHSRTASQDSMRLNSTAGSAVAKPARQRRKTIPEKPNYSLNLWSIMKNWIGKELTKIPMPVNIGEPLSFLQRLAEDFEYTSILDRAVKCEDQYEQLAHIAAFAISAYATASVRAAKPFNPLLGETYEFDRTDDMGWRMIAEQVSHHPPVCAMNCDSKEWSSWQEYSMTSKFRGKYLQVNPLGTAHLHMKKSKHHFTWGKVSSTVHNIIVGRLWCDHHGEIDIINHMTGDSCHLKFLAYSYFSRDVPRKVTGVVTDSNGVAHWVLSGTWDNKVEGAKVIKTVETSKGKTVYETGPTKLLWQRNFPPTELEKCYNFTRFAVELNEPEDGVAPTDSRLRPDQRLMEDGQWDEANKIKVQLEEKQRTVRRKREIDAQEATTQGLEYQGWEPRWFRKETDAQTDGLIHAYKGGYWEAKSKQDWSMCPDIFF